MMLFIFQSTQLIPQLDPIRAFAHEREDCTRKFFTVKLDQADPIVLLDMIVEDLLDRLAHLVFREFVEEAELVN